MPTMAFFECLMVGSLPCRFVDLGKESVSICLVGADSLTGDNGSDSRKKLISSISERCFDYRAEVARDLQWCRLVVIRSDVNRWRCENIRIFLLANVWRIRKTRHRDYNVRFSIQISLHQFRVYRWVCVPLHKVVDSSCFEGGSLLGSKSHPFEAGLALRYPNDQPATFGVRQCQNILDKFAAGLPVVFVPRTGSLVFMLLRFRAPIDNLVPIHHRISFKSPNTAFVFHEGCF